MAEGRGAKRQLELGLVLTCEHAGREVPARWRALFRGRERLLDSHRGWDRGALELAREIGRRLGVRPLVHRASRLLVDLNRSLSNPALFSEVTRGLDPAERELLVDALWRPHRALVRQALLAVLERRPRVCHVGVHSFTPVLRGERRRMHVGLLYDPGRPGERALAARWRAELAARAPQLVVRRNAPYRGTADGLTTALRAELGPRYLGLEVEVRHDLLAAPARRRGLGEHLAASLGSVIRGGKGL